MERPEPAPRGGQVLVIVAVLVAATVLLFAVLHSYDAWTERYSPRARAAASIEPHVAGMLSEPIAPPAVKQPFVRGKLVVIDRASKAVDRAFFELAPGAYANDASEIGTVALVDCEPKLLGDFRLQKGTKRVVARAYATTCRVEVVDWAARASTGVTWITSEERPPREMFAMFYKSDWHAKRPAAAIARWLIKLPRQ